MYLTVDNKRKKMTQIFVTHLHFIAGIIVGTASRQVLWKVLAASGLVLWKSKIHNFFKTRRSFCSFLMMVLNELDASPYSRQTSFFIFPCLTSSKTSTFLAKERGTRVDFGECILKL